MNKATVIACVALASSALAIAGPGSYEPTPEQQAKLSKMMDQCFVMMFCLQKTTKLRLVR